MKLASDIMEQYLKAGKAAGAAIKIGKTLARPGTKLLDLATLIEKTVKENGAELSFPVNLSLNECAAHYSPIIDDQSILPASGLLKIDVGAHVNGYIADVASTVNLNKNDEKYTPLIKAAEDALYHAIKNFKAGTSVREIGMIIQKEIEKFPGVKPISNLGGHQLKQWNLHAGTFVPNIGSTVDNYKLEEGDQFAVEPFSTDGFGAIKNGSQITIFRVANINKKKNPPMEDKLRMQKFKNKFHSLPFSARWVDFIPKNNVNGIIEKYNGWGVFEFYHTFVERGNGMVAQAEHTLIVEKDQAIPTTWWENFSLNDT